MENRDEILRRNAAGVSGGESSEDELENEAYLTPAMIWSLMMEFEDDPSGEESGESDEESDEDEEALDQES
jgi:hypothetical protein